MRIAFVTIRLYGGGAENSNLTIIRMLLSLGYTVDTFCSITSENSEDLKKELSIEYLDENGDSLFRKFQKPFLLRAYLKKGKYDLIIDGRTRPLFVKEFIFYQLIYKNQSRVFLVHSTKIEDYIQGTSILSKYLYLKHPLITVSKEIKKLIKEQYKEFNVNYIPNALPSLKAIDQSIEPFPIQGDYVLFFGRLVDNIKDISFMIKAFSESRLHKKGYKFVVLGSGPDEKLLKNLVESLNLNDSFIFISYVSDPFPYITNAKLSMMASVYEGMPMALIESLSVGCPVVTTDFKSGPSEIVETGKNGILVKEKTVGNFVQALVKMCEDEIFYQKCVEGSKISVEKFSFTSVSYQWDKFLKGI